MTCAICQDELDAPGRGRWKLDCGHVFHEACVLRMKARGISGRCPLCRYKSDDLTTVLEMMENASISYLSGSSTDSARVLSDVLTLEPGHRNAKVMLGHMCAEGTGVRRDVERAQGFLEESEHLVATTTCGMIYEQQGNVAKARELYEKSLSQGYAPAATCLGKLALKNGSTSEAVRLFEEGHRGGMRSQRATLAVST